MYHWNTLLVHTHTSLLAPWGTHTHTHLTHTLVRTLVYRTEWGMIKGTYKMAGSQRKWQTSNKYVLLLFMKIEDFRDPGGYRKWNYFSNGSVTAHTTWEEINQNQRHPISIVIFCSNGGFCHFDQFDQTSNKIGLKTQTTSICPMVFSIPAQGSKTLQKRKPYGLNCLTFDRFRKTHPIRHKKHRFSQT